ncbi:hypothetical protein JG688_00015428 [Phytophthora aleatoria]|uniref:Uncharacterized protein n=1 Tax=Phytophthora aleatoria TaxID=2496075 RepID=A0A8J5IFS5_9STRA|nr:hypothetical protein JG688_00015428 [Phytophthora aleatoria]
MIIHKVQGLTGNQVVFHCNSISSVAFAYVALPQVRRRTSIILTQPLVYDKLTTPPDRVTLFEAEELRVTEAVAATTERSVQIVPAMQEVTQAANQAALPRS